MANYKLRFFGKIPSTQTYAHDLIARGGGTDHTAIVAAAQSAGRGRYKHTWVSHHGNLYVSFIFDAPVPDGRLAYVIAVAVAETLISFGAPAQIKWPNDVMVGGKKISGILIEYSKKFVIIGIGINIATNPRVQASYTTTRLDKYSASATVMDVLGRLMQNLDVWRNAAFGDVRKRWMDLAVGLNSVVMYQGTEVEFVGIKENGAAILRRGTEELYVFGDEITMQ